MRGLSEKEIKPDRKMDEEELEKIKGEIKDYDIAIVISLWALALEEIEKRMKK